MPVGRRRKSLAPRKPCGRLKQEAKPKEAENIWPTPEIMARRAALLGSQSAVGELECPITLLGAKLDGDQSYAARKARSIYGRYAMVTQVPRIVVGSLRDYVQGSAGAIPVSPDQAEEYRAEFEETRRAILREVKWRFRLSPDRAGPASRQAWREVHSLMLGRMPRNLHALRYGLDAIVLHYDLAKSEEIVSTHNVRLEAA